MLLEIRDLEVRYGGIRAVKGIDLDVREGELVCLIGANGAGKTSTLQGDLRPAARHARQRALRGDDIRGARCTSCRAAAW
jgi:branched-chain amino acid transport system ATP-binding protein